MTKNPNINVYRVVSRMESGGHGVPADKVVSRYEKCMKLIPKVLDISDTFYLFDNSDELTKIAVKKRNELVYIPNNNWSEREIRDILGVQ